MPRLSDRLQQPRYLAPWCVLAAFGSYACMYGFRKPFTAGSYADGAGLAEFDLKALLVSSQVLGYTLSKILGIRVVSAMAAAHRARTILLLIGIAYLALLGFALTPAPWSAAFLFVNGLPLGMVYGLVLGFLEGRRQTELFVAGQCASFILADGITKSVGRGLLDAGVTEQWMPFVAGTVFLAPLSVFVWMLQRIPAPTDEDVTARSRRVPMTARDRLVMLRRHGLALVIILVAYLLVTVLRSLRADFAPEIWAGLGVDAKPSIFTASEFWVALGIMLEIAKGQKPDAFFHCLQHPLQREGRVECHKQMPGPLPEAEPLQVVTGTRESFHVVEFRHGAESAVEVEPPAVIAAHQLAGLARLGHQKVSAVGADVGQAAHLSVRLAAEQQRLIDHAAEQRHGGHGTGIGELRGRVADPLPAFRENAVLGRLEHLIPRIEFGRQGLRLADVRVDVERLHARLRSVFLAA